MFAAFCLPPAIGCGRGLSAAPVGADDSDRRPSNSAGAADVMHDGPDTQTAALPLGSSSCTSGEQRSTGACVRDVGGTSRCCQSDCRAAGRVCSTAGECVCENHRRDVGGECLLRGGERCQRASDCASGQCHDAVCCESACDGICERCDAPGTEGTCTLHAEDLACIEQPGFECTARRRCRLPLGATCGA